MQSDMSFFEAWNSFVDCNYQIQLLYMLFIYSLKIVTEAVPKRILELMNVPGLTRENVASHLQVWLFVANGSRDGHHFYINFDISSPVIYEFYKPCHILILQTLMSKRYSLFSKIVRIG